MQAHWEHRPATSKRSAVDIGLVGCSSCLVQWRLRHSRRCWLCDRPWDCVWPDRPDLALWDIVRPSGLRLRVAADSEEAARDLATRNDVPVRRVSIVRPIPDRRNHG